MLKLLVIADDFTGALDTGVQFSNQGIKTTVSTNTQLFYENIPQNAEVLVLNTESRHLSFDQAYNRIKQIIEEANKLGIAYIYKKVDSALRGNVSAEVKAILDACDQDIIPFLPAYPEINRILLNGNLYIDDLLVTESVFARDPYEPVTESNVLKRLFLEAGVEATLIRENQILNEGEGIYIFDSQTNEMMIAQAEMLKQKNLLGISIGCAGFAKVLANQLFPNSAKENHFLKKPVVVVCGSVNPITKKQIEYAEKRYVPRISLDATQLLKFEYWESNQGKTEIKEYLTLMEDNDLVIFETLSKKTTKDIKIFGQKNHMSTEECRIKIGESLGNLTKKLWHRHEENTFLFTGGDTLYQSMNVLGVTEIQPITEIYPGVVLSTIKWQGTNRNVVTKSGGFGSEKLFIELSTNKEKNKGGN